MGGLLDQSQPLFRSGWAAVVLVLGLLSCAVVNASKFDESFTMVEGKRFGPIVEGPMYGADGAFIGFSTGTPFVGFEGVAQFMAGSEPASLRANLTVYHTSSKDILPIFDTSLADALRFENASMINCDTSKGMPTKEIMHAFGHLEKYEIIELSGKDAQVDIDFRSPVLNTGYQYIVFVLCRRHHKSGIMAPIEASIDGTLIFRNPYGYLPARYYGFLPFLGILASVYFGMFLVYGYLSVKHRRTILRMQYGVLAVIIMGVIETTTWFLTYVVMNDSGSTSCCPWRSDVVFAMFAKNVKQTVSGMLVLAVALGWGVVRSSLSRKATFAVIMLGFFYLAFSVKFDLVRMERISHAARTDSDDTNAKEEGNSAFWAFPVALCDVLFILAIYFGLIETSQELENDHQEAKLEMYQRLTGTLRYWGILWFVFTFFDLGTRIGVIPWPWSLEFLLWSFWDILYLGVLLRIAIIWRPTETSDRYAYSSQLPTGNVLDEFETPEFEENSAQKEKQMNETN